MTRAFLICAFALTFGGARLRGHPGRRRAAADAEAADLGNHHDSGSGAAKTSRRAKRHRLRDAYRPTGRDAE